MATISQLQKQAKLAPKFVLSSSIFGLYIADKKLSGGEEKTDNIDHALKFSVGYDCEKMKSRAWSLSTGIFFTPKYL